MTKRLEGRRAARARGQRYGSRYNFGATYYDARDEAIRRGDRVVGTEHMVLALLADPASPAARALGCDLESARAALDAMDAAALAAIGVHPGITAGPITVRPQGEAHPSSQGHLYRHSQREQGPPGRPRDRTQCSSRPAPPGPRGRTPRGPGGGHPGHQPALPN